MEVAHNNALWLDEAALKETAVTIAQNNPDVQTMIVAADLNKESASGHICEIVHRAGKTLK
jgi:hypothetical protein